MEEELPGYQEIPLVEALNGKIRPENIPEGNGRSSVWLTRGMQCSLLSVESVFV